MNKIFMIIPNYELMLLRDDLKIVGVFAPAIPAEAGIQVSKLWMPD